MPVRSFDSPPHAQRIGEEPIEARDRRDDQDVEERQENPGLDVAHRAQDGHPAVEPRPRGGAAGCRAQRGVGDRRHVVLAMGGVRWHPHESIVI